MGNALDHLFAGKEVPSRQIVTKYGPIEGKRIIYEGERMVDAYLGYPYAKAPIGELRFKKPVAPDPWTEVKKCVKFGARSVQTDLFFFDKWKLGPSSEDCLFLNVFTPEWKPTDVNGFPVMVFVHGGGYVMDSTIKYGDIGIAKYLVRHGVVVVTLQYRLGYLGFFSTGDAECPGNNGLWDQTFALQWVNDNIGAFNGDRSRITLFGQSAGGASVDLLSLSPHSRDLFENVIPMAGNASADWSLCQNVVETSRQLASKVGCHETDSRKLLDALRNIPAHRFAAGLVANVELKKMMEMPIGPRFDGDFFPKPIDQLRAEAPIKRRLVGTALDEGLLFAIFASDPLNMDTLVRIIAENIPESKHRDFKELREKALRHYINNDVVDDAQIKHAVVNIVSDMMMNVMTQKHVDDQLALGNQNVYFYSFDYFNPKSFGLIGYRLPFKGPTHCTELAYIFGVGIIWSFKFNQDDEKMIDMTTKIFTNFAKYKYEPFYRIHRDSHFSNPNGAGDDTLPFQWQPATKDHPSRYLSIKLEQTEMQEPYYQDRPRFWLDIYQKANAYLKD